MEQVDFEVAKKQISRLAGLDDYPQYYPEAEIELVRIAMRYAASEAHLESTINEVCEVWLNCPKPAELRGMLQRERQEFVNRACPHCAGSGWKIVERKGISGVARCPCGSIPRDPGIVLADTRRGSSTGLLETRKIKFLMQAATDPTEQERQRLAEQDRLRQLDAELKRVAAEQDAQRKPRTKAEIEAMLYPRKEPLKKITQSDIDAAKKP